MVDNGMDTNIALNSGGRSASATHGTELEHLGSVVREGRRTLAIELAVLKETEIGLSSALNSESSFLSP
jgi:hypothetical protein